MGNRRFEGVFALAGRAGRAKEATVEGPVTQKAKWHFM